MSERKQLSRPRPSRSLKFQVEELTGSLAARNARITELQEESTELVTRNRELRENNALLRRSVDRLTPVDVVVAVIRSANGLIIGKRLPTEVLGGYWHFIGGKLEMRESHKEALEREVKEEIGERTRIDIEQLICRQFVVYEHGVCLLHFYDCELRSRIDALTPIKVSEVRAVHFPELLNFNMLEADMNVAQLLYYKERAGLYQSSVPEPEDDD